MSKKKPKDEWAINKVQMAQVQDDKSNTSSTDQSAISSQSGNLSTQNDNHVGWACVHCSFLQEASLHDLILLDSNSTKTIFCNPKNVKNIQNTHETLELGTNGDPLHSTMKCDVPV